MAALGWNASLIEAGSGRVSDSPDLALPGHVAPVAQLRILEALKPYLLLASAAFTLGFAGYWGLGLATADRPAIPPEQAWQAPASAPAPDTPLNSMRHV
jgi:hypothetical protein